jgi:hypothetical protein
VSSQLDLLEVTCDSPSYEIVRACETIGFWSPLDVRWCRMNGITRKRTGWWQRLWHHPWQTLRSLGQVNQPRCSCGYPLSHLRTFEIHFRGEGEADYLLAQCPWCRTMFWDEVS